MKRFFLPLIALISAAWGAQGQDRVADYVDKFKFIAIAEMERSGIPASIKMAQGILESGIGESELATTANNHFGIKCGGDWRGGSHYVWDDEPQKSCFRVYLSAEESYIAHSEFLRNPAKEFRYGFLFKLQKEDYKSWAKGLQSSGYATSKTYSEKLISLIERYELYKLDHLSLRSTKVSDTTLAQIREWQDIISKDTSNLEHSLDTARINNFVPAPTLHSPIASFWEVQNSKNQRKEGQIFTVNGLPAVLLKKGQNLQQLCKERKVGYKKLFRWNNLKSYHLQAGQYIFLKAKKNRYEGKEQLHQIQLYETLHEVSQFYGVKERSLRKLNPQFAHKTPQKGDSVRLRK